MLPTLSLLSLILLLVLLVYSANSLCQHVSKHIYFNIVSEPLSRGLQRPCTCFLAFHPTISMLKSTATFHPKFFASSTSCASCAGQVRCADLITAQVGSFSFLCFGPSRSKPIVGPFEVWLFVSPSPSSAIYSTNTMIYIWSSN
jgi:hypothetical protein